jgi:hypothetical protein
MKFKGSFFPVVHSFGHLDDPKTSDELCINFKLKENRASIVIYPGALKRRFYGKV